MYVCAYISYPSKINEMFVYLIAWGQNITVYFLGPILTLHHLFEAYFTHDIWLL